MAMMLHENSCACVGSQLDIFNVPGTQTSQEKNTYVPHYPISDVGNVALEFDVKPSTMYTDLSDTRLYLRCKVMKNNKTVSPAGVDVSVSNMLFHALMQRIDVFIGNTLITQSNAFYPWKAGMETLLNFGTDAKQSQLAMIGYDKDGKQMKELVKNSHEFELWGPLHVDFFSQPKYLIDNVPLRVKIGRSASPFYMVNKTGDEYGVVITEAVLWIRRVDIAPSIQLAHTKSLMSGKNALYPMHRGEIEVVSIPQTQQTVTKDNFFMARLPKKVIIAMVPNDVFNGKKNQDPYEFKHYNLKSLEVTVDGENVCGTPLQLDFDDQKYMRAYDGMFHAFNKSYSDTGSDISYEDFKKKYPLFCFDLTADGCGNSGGHFELIKQGNLRLKLHFDQPLTETISVIVYGEFESILEINKNREVLIDYK